MLALLAGLGVAWAEVEFRPYGNEAKAPDNDSVRRVQSAEKQLQAERQRTAELERQLREAKAATAKAPPAPPPAPHPMLEEMDGFILLPGGVARDKVTGLEWMRCSLGQSCDGKNCTGEAKGYGFYEAKQVAEALNAQGGYAGKTDWRVLRCGSCSGWWFAARGWANSARILKMEELRSTTVAWVIITMTRH